ncbi:hypothetical protein ACP4OV_008253 [Aristida adscensionis]
MAGVVGVWLGEFAKFGPPEAARAGGAEAGRCRQGGDGIDEGARGENKGVVVQEKRRTNSGVFTDSEAVVCILMDHFAPS